MSVARYIDAAMKILKADKKAEGAMWQAFTETDMYREGSKNITSFPIACWVAEYIDNADPKIVTLKISREDLADLIKTLREARDR